jgi:hypothetical protein
MQRSPAPFTRERAQSRHQEACSELAMTRQASNTLARQSSSAAVSPRSDGKRVKHGLCCRRERHVSISLGVRTTGRLLDVAHENRERFTGDRVRTLRPALLSDRSVRVDRTNASTTDGISTTVKCKHVGRRQRPVESARWLHDSRGQTRPFVPRRETRKQRCGGTRKSGGTVWWVISSTTSPAGSSES